MIALTASQSAAARAATFMQASLDGLDLDLGVDAVLQRLGEVTPGLHLN